jgi:hypothetical protein
MVEQKVGEGNKDSNEVHSACQLKSIYEGMNDIFSALTLSDRAKLFLLQLRCKMQARVDKLLRRLRKDRPLSQNGPGFKDVIGPEKGEAKLSVGDLVQVLSLQEIERTLDSNGKTQGLWFMPGMNRYCGTTARVLRKVNYIFDERAWGMVKCGKNVYLLENMLCTGQGMFDKEGCDRCCFFFWHACWLRKL